MNHVAKLFSGVDVAPLLTQLDQHPGLWDEIPYRRVGHGTPHANMVDIWCRYNDIRPYVAKGDFTGLNDEHTPIWYPCIAKIPAAKSLALNLKMRLSASELGAVLITKMLPGAVIHPHTDAGWHAGHFNCKVYTILRANDECVNRYLDEEVVMRPGECWSFDNSVTHSVENQGSTERIALITCLRVQ